MLYRRIDNKVRFIRILRKYSRSTMRTLYEFTKRPSDIKIKNNGLALSFKLSS